MKNIALKRSIYPLIFAAVTLLQNCKKVDRKQSLNNSFATEKAEARLATLESKPVTSISWATAKGQPSGTHEIHGEAVNGKLYIFGGYDINKRPQWTPTKRAYVYDPVANTWASIKSLPHEPFGSNFGGVTHVGVTTDGVDIYFAGGYVSNPEGTGQVFGTKQAWKYNVASNVYTRLPDLPQALAAGQLRYVNGKIHYMGGANLSRADTSIHLALNLNNLAAGWKALAPVHNAVNHPGSVMLQGKIYFLGGAHHQDNNTVTQRTLEVYNEQTDSWTDLAEMPFGVDHISSSVAAYGNELWVLGGETSHNVLSNRVSAYDPDKNTWRELTPMKSPRSAGVAAVLNGDIYYSGGNFSNVLYKGIPITTSTALELLPSDDAFVRNGSFANNNYGSDTSLLIKGATVNNYFRSAYLKFSIASLAAVNSATLRVYGRNVDNATIINLSCYAVDNDNWLEGTIVYNNAPPAGSGTLRVSAANNQNKFIDFDVTDYVKKQLAGDKMISLLLKDADNKNATIQLNSKENKANRPVLIIK